MLNVVLQIISKSFVFLIKNLKLTHQRCELFGCHLALNFSNNTSISICGGKFDEVFQDGFWIRIRENNFSGGSKGSLIDQNFGTFIEGNLIGLEGGAFLPGKLITAGNLEIGNTFALFGSLKEGLVATVIANLRLDERSKKGEGFALGAFAVNVVHFDSVQIQATEVVE